jgi:hypothetical protein
MVGNRFDTITRRLASVASRRHVLGGLGVAAVGALVGREAGAAPVEKCNKECNAAAKEARKACKGDHGKGHNSKDKNACLKRAKDARVACLSDCPPVAE